MAFYQERMKEFVATPHKVVSPRHSHARLKSLRPKACDGF